MPRRFEPAHPRVCGENFRRGRGRFRCGGSSPRVRGKLKPRLQVSFSAGLIPACAGKTMMPLIALDRTGAHPRVCGENIVAGSEFKRHEGSSPRVRGKRAVECAGHVIAGLIPACAGKTIEFSLLTTH